MDDDLIAAHRDLPSLMPFLHLPVQSGSDRILAAMNRRHTAADYLPPGGEAARRPAGHRAVVGLHRRPSWRDRRRFSRPPWPWCARSASPRPTASNIRRAPARPPPAPRTGPGAGEGIAAWPNLQALLRDQQAAFNAACVGLTAARAVHRPRPPSRADRRPLTISSASACNCARRPDRPGNTRADRRRTP